jgi:predicted Na+-dependent transporter
MEPTCALGVNFVVIPLLAWGIAEHLSLDEGLAIGIIGTGELGKRSERAT